MDGDSVFHAFECVCAPLAIAACLAAAGPVSAQWTVTNLHPAGASESYAYGVGPGPGGAPQQVGYATIGGVSHAVLWSGSAVGWIDLHPTGAAAVGVTNSVALGVSGSQQAGVVYVGTSNLPSAALWTSTAASWQNIGPPAIPFQPAPVSQANAIQNGVVVGSAGNTSGSAAARWDAGVLSTLSGTSAAGIDGASIVGTVRTGSFPLYGSNAVLWTGTPAVGISLHSSGLYTSYATGVSGNQQVGNVIIGSLGGPTHAYLWTGSAAAFVDLNPSGATGSEAFGVSAGTQAGNAKFLIPAIDPANSVSRAAIWTGSAAGWVNLHALLPADFKESFARGIYKSATTTSVVGYGVNTTTNRYEALLWTRANCVPATISTPPGNASACPGGAATFTVGTAGSGPITYLWFWQVQGMTPTTPVVEGINFMPGNFEPAFFATGANTASVSVSQFGPTFMNPGPPRLFRCSITGECGSAGSGFVTLSIGQGCPADFDCSGGLAIDDIFAFLNAWLAGSPNANFDGLNGLQVQDIFAFLNAWLAGC